MAINGWCDGRDQGTLVKTSFGKSVVYGRGCNIWGVVINYKLLCHMCLNDGNISCDLCYMLRVW